MNKELCTDVKNQLVETANILYKRQADVGIANMKEIIPRLSVILSEIQEEEVKNNILNNALVPLLQAMEERDTTLMADIITYDLVEIIEKL